MKNVVFLFVGLVLMITGGIVAMTTTRVKVNNQIVTGDEATSIMWMVGGGIAGLGFLFFLFGFIGRIGDKKRNQQITFIAQNGTPADAIVTFYDKNYSILVNKRPIYSIVEYKFKDTLGAEYVRRVDTVISDWAIRNKIEVGGTVKIKYLSEDPTQSVILVNV